MPLYEFKNSSGKIIEIFRSFKEDIPSSIKITIKDIIFTLPSGNISKEKRTKEFKGIKSGVYNRVFSVPYAIMDAKKPKTIGSLASKNTEKMIKEGKLKPKKKENPWWRKDKKKIDTDLSRLSDKKKREYILTGKK